MANKKITNDHVQDVYNKFRSYIKTHGLNILNDSTQSKIVEDIKGIIKQESKFEWNEASLADYINNLIYMFKGQTFARTINKYAENYFIENICKDFEENICENAKKSLKMHKEYYNKIINRNRVNGDNTEKKKECELSKKIHNIILYGVPGVGKTHNVTKLIDLIKEGQSPQNIFEMLQKNEKSNEVLSEELQDRVKFITFHQSFGYEDFIEGFRPNEDGNIEIQEGIFKRICQEASENPERNHYLVIDEINRGNISKIFGELITLIEEDKRDKLEVTLPYSKEPFKVPSNLYIIGTMNTADKSIALIDVALRRRFTFVKMKPKANLIEHAKARKIFEELNQSLAKRLDNDHLIGHSYFMGINSDEDLQFVLDYKIKPLLEEYFYGDKEGLDEAWKRCRNEVLPPDSGEETSVS